MDASSSIVVLVGLLACAGGMTAIISECSRGSSRRPGCRQDPSRRTLCVAALAGLTALPISCHEGGVEDAFETPPTDCGHRGNVVENCGFDSGLSGWTVNQNTDTGTWRHVADDGASRPGCVEVDGRLSGTQYFASITRCVGMPPNPSAHEFGVTARILAGVPETCIVSVGTTDADCGPSGPYLGDTFQPTGSWGTSSVAFPSPPYLDDEAVNVRAECWGPDPFTIRFDDYFLAPESSQP